MPKQPTSRTAKQIQIIRRSVGTIGRALRRLSALSREIESAAQDRTAGPRRRLRLSPERRVALKLQGTYLGYIRHLKPSQRARVKDERAKRGVRRALALAKRLAKSQR